MEFLKIFKKRNRQPAVFSEQQNETSFSRELESLKKSLKEYGLSYYETRGGDNKATGMVGVGDIAKEKMEAFQQKLGLIIERFPERADELREEIIRISQNEDSTGVRDKNSLAYFAGEIRNLFPPHSDQYSNLNE